MKVDKVYVTSCKSGFYTSTPKSFHDSLAGDSESFPGMYIIEKVKYENGSWVPTGYKEYWSRCSWDAHINLTGGEPWRWYA